MLKLFRLICLASIPMIGLTQMPATAAPAPGLQGPSAVNGRIAQVQYLPEDPPAVVEEDDDYSEFQGDAASRCAAQFRSFEPDTGYYTTYDGDRVLCPYLQ